jgi:hypothetical protein
MRKLKYLEIFAHDTQNGFQANTIFVFLIKSRLCPNIFNYDEA